MVELIENKREAKADVCARHGVSRLDVSGSALGNELRPGESDVDFLVELGAMDPYERVDACFDMLDELRALLGVDVDLVMAGAVKNRYIAADIERTKQALYAA